MIHVKEILLGIAILIGVTLVLASTFGGAWYTAHQNMIKEQTMTRYCVEHGFGGWTDEGDRNTTGASTCTRN